MKKLLLLLAGWLTLFSISCKNYTASSPTTTAIVGTDSSWMLLPFIKIDSVNPVLTPAASRFTDPIIKKEVKWEEKDVFNPATAVRGDTLLMLYRAEDSIGRYAGTSRISLAKSTDGIHFTRMPLPVLYPSNDA